MKKRKLTSAERLVAIGLITTIISLSVNIAFIGAYRAEMKKAEVYKKMQDEAKKIIQQNGY